MASIFTRVGPKDWRFPFAVYYRVDGEVICVLAVLDCRSSPTFQRNRLR